jgi:putative ABC transport system permease protein
MSIREVILLAIESLTANKLRAGLTMLGMVIGVSAVVSLVSIGNGAKLYVTQEFEGMGTNIIRIQPGKSDTKSGFAPPTSNTKKKLTLADVEAIERQASNIEAITGVAFGAASAKFDGRESSVSVMGTGGDFPKIVNQELRLGSYFTKEEDHGARRVVVLGHSVAENLFGDVSALGQTVKINESDYRVIGVAKKEGMKLGFNMDTVIFIPVKAALRLFNDEKLFDIRARARSKASLNDAVEEIRSILFERKNGNDDVTISTQASMMGTMNTILDMLTWALGGIAMISMAVGGIGIMNIMLVSVTERTKEIGIRRAVGATQSDIMKQFVAEALALSLAGGLIGLLLSITLSYIGYWITPAFDIRAPGWILVPAFLMSTLTGLIFGVLPARRAARIEAMEALRYE